MHELGSPQLDGQCSIESLQMADEGVVPEHPRGEGGMIGSARCEGSTAGHARIDVQVYWVPVILMNEEYAVGGREEMIKPGKILVELGGEGEGFLFRTLPVEEQVGWRTHLGYVEQLAQKGAKLPESDCRFPPGAESLTTCPGGERLLWRLC